MSLQKPRVKYKEWLTRSLRALHGEIEVLPRGKRLGLKSEYNS